MSAIMEKQSDRNNFDLVLKTNSLGPAAQHESVIGSNDRDDVDALCLESVVLLDEWREVVYVAGRLLKVH